MMTAGRLLSLLLYATATIFPSMEYVDEIPQQGNGSAVGMVPTGPPVWRSQLVNSPSLNWVNKWLSGEKLSHRFPIS